MPAYLAIDLGTTGCRSILFDGTLNVLGSAYEEYGRITGDGGAVEQDAALWWEMTLRTAKKAMASVGTDPRDIKGISVSSQGITVVPVDEKIEPLCNALSWLDIRAKDETARLLREEGDRELFLHTGKHIDAVYTLPKLMWLRDRRPEIFSAAYMLLMPMDYIIGKLTGRCVTDHSMASGTLMYDIRNSCWSGRILEKYGIPEEKLPVILQSGETAGTVLPEVADELGLSRDCTVAVGAQDQKCAAFGAGLEKGVITVSLGTACAVTKLWSEPRPDLFSEVGWCGYVRENAWVTEGVINTAGASLRWLRDFMFRGESYDVMDREAGEALEKESSVMFFPYLSDPGAEGVFTGLNLATDKGCFALAVLEGVAFRIRSLLGKMDAYSDTDSVVLFGGGAKSSLWCQLIADITGMKVMVPVTEEAAGAGAARLAALGCGEKVPHLGYERTFSPSERKKAYEDKYRRYRETEDMILRQ